jgi:hypothetical protein
MSIFDDSFSIELNNPLDEEAWKVIEDVELDNTERIYFITPSDKRVEFIKADVLDKIRAEVMNLTDGETPERIWNVDVLQIIGKYITESEET